jgi:hypothetical protein
MLQNKFILEFTLARVAFFLEETGFILDFCLLFSELSHPQF